MDPRNLAANLDVRGQAELRRQEAVVLTERAREQALNARASALGMAVQVCAHTGDAKEVVKAAEQFAIFLLAEHTPTPTTNRQ